MPAMELVAPSSTVDDDRTTTGRSPPRDRVDHAARSSASTGSWPSPPAGGANAAVVATRPGSTGSPAWRARASDAALAPATSGSSAARVSRAITAPGASTLEPVSKIAVLTSHPLGYCSLQLLGIASHSGLRAGVIS